jgi:protoporphyrinogen IX oxidase
MLLLFKSLHIVGFVAWFAGLFYLVRMFVYHREAQDAAQPERDILSRQFHLMEKRVYKIICNPAMMLTWTCGLIMLYLHGWEWLMVNSWMHLKLVLLVGLTAYQLWCKKTIEKLAAGNFSIPSFRWRLLNEVPTLFLLAIALLAVYRNALDFGLAFLGIIGFMILLVMGARAYRKVREKNPEA